MRDKNLNGVPCPTCGSTERRVIESRPQLNEIRRRCVCQRCLNKFTTIETLIDRNDKVSSDFLFAVLKGLSSIEKAISNLRASLETGLENYK
jgi:transcriptional regulator NrdR family protein